MLLRGRIGRFAGASFGALIVVAALSSSAAAYQVSREWFITNQPSYCAETSASVDHTASPAVIYGAGTRAMNGYLCETPISTLPSGTLSAKAFYWSNWYPNAVLCDVFPGTGYNYNPSTYQHAASAFTFTYALCSCYAATSSSSYAWTYPAGWSPEADTITGFEYVC